MIYLREKLDDYRDSDVAKFIITDSLFSMGGDFIDARILLDLAEKYNAILVLDNAHADGLYGAEGMGVLKAQNISAEKDLQRVVQIGTLSKTFATMGGYIIFPESSFVSLARFSQWKYIFSAAIPSHIIATCIDALDLIRGNYGDELRRKLESNSVLLRNKLVENGFDIMSSSSHIVPTLIRETDTCLKVQEYLLRKHSLWAAAARYPVVPEKKALLRWAVTAGHTEDDINQLVNGLIDAREQFAF